MKKFSVFSLDKNIVGAAFIAALRKLDPRAQIRNPVMFMVYVGAIMTSIPAFWQGSAASLSFKIQLVSWLWLTILFANFAGALAEGQTKARTDALRTTRGSVLAKKTSSIEEKKFSVVNGQLLRKGDLFVCEAGDDIAADGEIIAGAATVDESAITGESAPVIRESGGDRSAVTAGTRVLSDRIVIRVTQNPGDSFLDRMITLIEGAKRSKTPAEIALTIVLSVFSIVFLVAVMSLPVFYEFAAGGKSSIPLPSLIALLVCLIPTTIAGLLSAVRISGMNQLLAHNVLAMSGRAVEAAGDVDVLLLDKTGTITLGNRQASEFFPAPGVEEYDLASWAQLASLADETPEGRSIVVLAKNKFSLRERSLSDISAIAVPFSATTRMSGSDLNMDGKQVAVRKGAFDAIAARVQSMNGSIPDAVKTRVDEIAKKGGTPLVVARDATVMGCIYLKDIVKGGIRERFVELRKIGIRTVMITGDNALTAASIAAEAGVDDYIAEAKPETKLARIRTEQSRGHMVAMIGDGTNDAPALAQPDIGVAMQTGTQVAREAGNMVDLDSNPTKLLEIVEIGKKILMTREALTTFSIANDVAKYFAILPAILGSLYAVAGVSPIASLNVMRLSSPESAILSAVIFNALIIIAMIPIAMKGVQFRPMNASALLSRNLLIYGLGGLIAPFIGIFALDIIVRRIV